jgi:hypothetical protein
MDSTVKALIIIGLAAAGAAAVYYFSRQILILVKGLFGLLIIIFIGAISITLIERLRRVHGANK